MPDIIDQIMAQRAAQRAQSGPMQNLELYLKLKQFQMDQDQNARANESSDLINQGRRLEIANTERTNQQRTTAESFARNIAMIDPASMTDQTAAEIHKSIDINEKSGVLSKQEADAYREQYPLGLSGRNAIDKYNYAIKLADIGKLPESALSDQGRTDLRAIRSARLTPATAPANPLEESLKQSQEHQASEDVRIRGLFDTVRTLADIKKLDERDQMPVARLAGLDKQLEAERTRNAESAAGGFSTDDVRILNQNNAMRDDLNAQLDPVKGGKNLYTIIPASEAKKRTDEYAASLGRDQGFAWWDDPRNGATSHEDIDRKVAMYGAQFKPVRMNELDQETLDQIGEGNFVYAPANKAAEDAIAKTQEQVAALLNASYAIIKSRTDALLPKQPEAQKARPGYSGGESVSDMAPTSQESPRGSTEQTPLGQVGTFDNLRRNMQVAVQGGEDPAEWEARFSDPEQRKIDEVMWNATPEQLDALLRELAGL